MNVIHNRAYIVCKYNNKSKDNPNTVVMDDHVHADIVY